MMAMTKEQKEIKKIMNQVVEDMKALGTYREQFIPVIAMYAEMRYQLAQLNKQFYDGGCRISEDYTNKAGATNDRKTALYGAIEQLRRDIQVNADRLGLTPAGMKRINETEMKPQKKKSSLDKILESHGK